MSRSTPAECRRARSRALAASACSTTNGAAAATPWTCCARSSEGSCRADVRANPRAVRADPSVSVGGGRVRRGPGHALGGRQRRHAHLRRGLPRPVRGRPPVHPRAAAGRRSVPVPAGSSARRGGARADLPHRPRLRPRAGAVVRDRADLLLRHDRGDSRPPRARALPLHDRGRGDRPARAAAPARDRRAGERRVSGDQGRPDPVPARRVRQARHHHLPRELPARDG